VTATALGALIIILAGATLRRFGLAGPEDGPLLVRIVIYVTLPALVFLILVRAELDPELILVPVAGWIVHLTMLGLAFAAATLWGFDRPMTGAMAVSIAVGNTGFFGLPLIAASGAGVSLPAAVMYDALATGIITWTSTVLVASAYGTASTVPGLDWGRLWRALLLPPNWALVAGLTVNLSGVHDLPQVLERPLELLAGAVLPLVMLYAGLVLEARALRRLWAEVATATVLRLGVAALVGAVAAWVLGLRGEVFTTVVLMAAMPTAMMSLVIGTQFRLRADFIASVVLVTTLLSTVSLPVIRSLLP
jgi:predicted permease